MTKQCRSSNGKRLDFSPPLHGIARFCSRQMPRFFANLSSHENNNSTSSTDINNVPLYGGCWTKSTSSRPTAGWRLSQLHDGRRAKRASESYHRCCQHSTWCVLLV